MTSPISVLLIIGAAVVGPVEGQVVFEPGAEQAQQACYNDYTSKTPIAEIQGLGPNQRLVSSWRDACPASKFPRAPESLSQLCARAMREIGAARLVIEGDDKGWWLSPGPGEYGSSESVRCIPTPAGYRK